MRTLWTCCASYRLLIFKKQTGIFFCPGPLRSFLHHINSITTITACFVFALTRISTVIDEPLRFEAGQKGRKTIEARVSATARDQWESPQSGLPGCQASCGLFVTMRCDSNGDTVLGAMSLMMNSSTTIITIPPHTLSPPSKCMHTYTCVHKTQPPQHTLTHRRHIPQPLQHSPTYIWCWRVQRLRLARARPPPADSGDCWCGAWDACLCGRCSTLCFSLLEQTPPSCTRCIPVWTQRHHVTWARMWGLGAKRSYVHSDLRIDSNNCCSRSGLMTSCPVLGQLHAL